jgi:tRNA-splicing ligase RtcB
MVLKKISDYIWELPKTFKSSMKVAGRIVGSQKIIDQIEPDVYQQLANTASLPGIVKPVWAMPDTHVGFGVPIGGVFATNPNKDGVISPGAVGFDINCGVRLITTYLMEKELKSKLPKLINQLYEISGAGLGEESKLRLTSSELKKVLEKGSKWVVDNGYGRKKDLKQTEDNGQMQAADVDTLSAKALSRGKPQLGTLGSGNHYLEIQKVIKIFDSKRAKKMGINQENQITMMIHCGSRGLGHQVASDYSKDFKSVMKKYNINIPDDHLACAPFKSNQGQRYFKAMNCAANYAFANRQLIMHKARKVFGKVFQTKPKKIGLDLVYDVTHNMAKQENNLLIHRKGATRAFKDQPVIIGGSMETSSYLLIGTKKAEELTFGSTSHGAGRTMSRTQAKKEIHGKDLQQQMKNKGIYVKTASFANLAEEGGYAYKDINEVIKSLKQTGISKPIAQFQPLGNVKG